MRIVPLLLCLLTGAAALAQVPRASDAPLNEPPTLELEPGTHVQVVREQLRLEGRLLETNARFLTLGVDSPGLEREQIPLSDVLELSVRKRSVGYGALIGAGAGSIAGGLLGVYACALAEGATSQQCLLFVGAGGSAIGLMAAGLGAFIGFLIPRWDRVYERVLDGPLVLSPLEAPEELQAEATEAPPRKGVAQGGLFLSGVLTIAEPADAIGPGVRAEALAQLGTHVGVGLEVALHYLGRSLSGFPVNETMLSFGALMRAAPRPDVLTPSLLIGFSLHTAGQPATYSVGAGLDWAPPEGVPLAFELRWHQFNVPWKDGRQLTLGVGTRLFW